MMVVSRLDAALLGVFDCECCGTGCDCGCLTLCPVGADGHERQRQWLESRKAEEATDGR